MNISKCLRVNYSHHLNRKLYLEAPYYLFRSRVQISKGGIITQHINNINTKGEKVHKGENNYTNKCNNDGLNEGPYKHEEKGSRRRPVFTDRKVNNALNETIRVFRDLDTAYHFVKLQPKVSSTPLVSRIFWLKFANHTRDKLDLLEAWNQATTLPMSVEDAESDWVSSVQDQFVSRLCQALPEYDYDQLANITYSLGLLNNRLEHLNTLTSMVDSNLAKKMKEKLKKTDVTEEDIDQSLRIAFIWLRRGMETPHSHKSQLSGLHNRALIEILYSTHLSALTPAQTVFLLFLAGVQRELPDCRADMDPGQGFSLPNPLSEKLSCVLPLLSHREVGVVCHSLHQAHVYIETHHSAVRQAALHCLLNFPESDIVRDQFTLTGVTKFMRKRGSENTKHVVAIMEKFKPHLYSLNTYTKLRLLQFIIPGKPSPEYSREFTSKLCKSMVGQLNQMRLKDLEQFTFCLYFLNHRSINRVISKEIGESMLKCDWANVRSGKSFVFLVTFLARVGRFEEESINQIIEKANSCKMKNLHTDSGLAEAIQFLFQLNIPWVRKAKTTYIINFIQRNRFVCRNSLAHVLELDCIRELYDLNCERLDPDLRKTLTEFLHSLPEYQYSYQVTEDGRIESSWFKDENRSLVQRDLSVILGGADHVWCGHPFPHSTSPVLIYALDKEGQPVTIPTDFCCFTSDSIISRALDKDYVWTAVIVPSKGMMDWRGNQFGPVNYKVEHLKKLGYKIRVVFWVDYLGALKAKRNLAFLRKLLKVNTSKKKIQ